MHERSDRVELGDALSRPHLDLDPQNVVEYLSLIVRVSDLVESVRGVVMGCRDPRDDKIFECAMNAPAEFIVTRDLDLLDASGSQKYAIDKTGIGIRDVAIRIMSVDEFLYDVLRYERAPIRTERARRR